MLAFFIHFRYLYFFFCIVSPTSQGLLTFFPGRSPFYLDRGKGVLEGMSDREHLLSDQELFPWRIAAANQTIPEVSPFFRSPVSMHVFCWWPSPA